MAVIELPPPVRVSPFIRGSRYLAFGSGLVYGLLRYKYLKRKETKRRDYEHKQKVILDAKKAEEDKINERKGMLALAKEMGITPAAGY